MPVSCCTQKPLQGKILSSWGTLKMLQPHKIRAEGEAAVTSISYWFLGHPTSGAPQKPPSEKNRGCSPAPSNGRLFPSDSGHHFCKRNIFFYILSNLNVWESCRPLPFTKIKLLSLYSSLSVLPIPNSWRSHHTPTSTPCSLVTHCWWDRDVDHGPNWINFWQGYHALFTW